MAGNEQILVVDDDPRIRSLLKRYLGAEGYTIALAEDGEGLRQYLSQGEPDLIILDLKLPDANGLTLAREVRARSEAVGLIILTGKGETVDKVVGLELGADDYVTKPFDERELLARVHTVLRRARRDRAGGDVGGSVLRFADWEVNLAAHELRDASGALVHLTTHEFQLLGALVTRPNRVLSRDQIMRAMTERDWNPYDRSVDVLVGKLRRKLNDDPREPRLIKTIRGAGYKFTARVTESRKSEKSA